VIDIGYVFLRPINLLAEATDKDVVSVRVFLNPFSRSLSLHLMLILLIALYTTVAPKIQTKDEPISISFIEPKSGNEKQRSIVQPSEGELTEKAKKDSYLSDKTRVVKEERAATNIGSTLPSGQPKVAQQAKSKPISVSDLGVKITTKQTETNEKQKNWASNSLGEAVHGGQYIQGLKQGETSALNTKEFVFFSYFERVRRQLDQTWQPMVRGQIERIYKTGRHLASQTDFTTRTLITINTKGEIVRVQLLQESGAMDLDSAAIGALNKAGPYPNPPKGLIDENGNAQIRWDFVLKT
jgi:TonB family protein